MYLEKQTTAKSVLGKPVDDRVGLERNARFTIAYKENL